MGALAWLTARGQPWHPLRGDLPHLPWSSKPTPPDRASLPTSRTQRLPRETLDGVGPMGYDRRCSALFRKARRRGLAHDGNRSENS